MRFSRKVMAVGLAAAVAGLAVAVTVATAGTARKHAGIQACGLMPDTKTSVRWEQFDKPYLQKAFKAAGVSARVVNAQGDPQKQKTQADQCISDGAKVLIIAPIDSGSAAAIEKAAAAKGVKSIDYDRQVEGGSAVLYASFNGKTVGILQGRGVISGRCRDGDVHEATRSSPRSGAARRTRTRTCSRAASTRSSTRCTRRAPSRRARSSSCPAGTTRRPARSSSRCSSRRVTRSMPLPRRTTVLPTPSSSSLKAHKLHPIPLSGQDATTQGVQNIISGWQTMTVFKDVRKLATATAGAAIRIIKGQKLPTTGFVTTKGRSKEPAYLISPQSITKKNWKILVTGGFLKRGDICNGEYKKYC